MKTDDEMYQSLIIRYDAYQAKKKRTLTIERTAAVLLGAAAVFAVGVTTRAMKPPAKPTVPETPAKPSAPTSCDIFGKCHI